MDKNTVDLYEQFVQAVADFMNGDSKSLDVVDELYDLLVIKGYYEEGCAEYDDSI